MSFFSVFVPVDGNAGVTFGVSEHGNGGPNPFDMYVAEIYEHEGTMRLFIGTETNGYGHTLPSTVSTSTVFGLGVNIDADDWVNWFLRVWDPTTQAWLTGNVDAGSNVIQLPGTSGKVGLFTTGMGGFAYLNVDADPVPVPSAILLLASGILGLAGISRRKSN